MTLSREPYLTRLKARQAALSREASRHPMLEQMPYREREADLMNEEAKLKLVIADHGDAK